ncbi:MAG: hypothetical protein UR81_C0008G0003 [Candidatus Levybacteria bacterium GW2011_GWB1_35_5]|nr:MAG: hypothetical protein UR81_C0008G0003 [Candidatus Levybacteria bacterium GW2011_GWB1_35_5]
MVARPINIRLIMYAKNFIKQIFKIELMDYTIGIDFLKEDYGVGVGETSGVGWGQVKQY